MTKNNTILSTRVARLNWCGSRPSTLLQVTFGYLVHDCLNPYLLHPACRGGAFARDLEFMVCAFFVKLSAGASEEQRSLFNFTDGDSRSNLFTYQSCQRLQKVPSENTAANVTLNPCQNPMRLLIELIEKFSKPGERILDLCSGTGTTAVACAVTNRNCTSLESHELQWRLIPGRLHGCEILL